MWFPSDMNLCFLTELCNNFYCILSDSFLKQSDVFNPRVDCWVLQAAVGAGLRLSSWCVCKVVKKLPAWELFDYFKQQFKKVLKAQVRDAANETCVLVFQVTSLTAYIFWTYVWVLQVEVETALFSDSFDENRTLRCWDLFDWPYGFSHRLSVCVRTIFQINSCTYLFRTSSSSPF